MCELFLSLFLFRLAIESPDYHDTVAMNFFVNGRDVEYRPEYVTFERLTVKESVGQIFLKVRGVDGGLQIDPAARPAIRRIIKNPNLKHYHGGAIGKLTLVGDADDVKIIAEYAESIRRSGKESSTTFTDIFWTLGAMANRHVEGADELLRKMCGREFWKDPSFENDSEWARGDEKLIWAIGNLARTNCDDLDMVVQRALDDTPAGPRREGLKKWLSPSTFEACKIEFDWRIHPLIPNHSRKLAISNFNGDLENPGPRYPDK